MLSNLGSLVVDHSKFFDMDDSVAHRNCWTNSYLLDGNCADTHRLPVDIYLYMVVCLSFSHYCMHYIHMCFAIFLGPLSECGLETQHYASRPAQKELKTWTLRACQFHEIS